MASKQEKADAAAARKCGDIHQAARNGDVPALRHMLRAAPGVAVHEKGSDVLGEIPLHGAALNGHVEAAELLLSKGAAVDAKDNDGEIPLHGAALNGHVAAAELLLSKGAAVDAKNDDGLTPLHWAACNGKVEAAELLLSKGAAVDAKEKRGLTPLHYATRNGKVEAAELLLSKGAAVDAKEKRGETPLHYAARNRNGNVEAAELLLSKGAAVEAKDNQGKTPLDLARERGKTEIEQLLLNQPADKASEEVNKDAAHAAGSGAVAVKHQRESSKEAVVQAAKELQAAMDLGDAQVLKNAIDNAKLHKVSPEDVMKALEKYIALQEAASQSATSPVGKAAKELQAAMDSGDAQVLKNAIDNAKLHKVSPEDVMKALEKYIALQEAASQSATSPVKEATTSKAESSVKLEPGHGARLAMFSARFNEKNKETETKFRAVHQLLVENQYEVLMVEAGEGKSFGDMTAQYLGRLKREKGIMLAVCTSDYGEMTASPFCTYFELKSAVEYKIDVLPLQVEDIRQPNPPCGKGHLDEHQKALGFIDLVFTPSTVQLDCRNKSVEEIATKIAAVLREPL